MNRSLRITENIFSSPPKLQVVRPRHRAFARPQRLILFQNAEKNIDEKRAYTSYRQQYLDHLYGEADGVPVVVGPLGKRQTFVEEFLGHGSPLANGT